MVTDAPPDYVRISSGLGEAPPVNLMVAADRVRGAGPRRHRGGLVQPVHPGAPGLPGAADGDHRRQREHDHRQLAHRHLLQESQRLAAELQSRTGELQARQEELQSSNAELEDKAAQLARQKRDIEIKNAEIEQPGRRSRSAPGSWTWPPGTSRSSSRTCRTSCARR